MKSESTDTWVMKTLSVFEIIAIVIQFALGRLVTAMFEC